MKINSAILNTIACIDLSHEEMGVIFGGANDKKPPEVFWWPESWIVVPVSIVLGAIAGYRFVQGLNQGSTNTTFNNIHWSLKKASKKIYPNPQEGEDGLEQPAMNQLWRDAYGNLNGFANSQPSLRKYYNGLIGRLSASEIHEKECQLREELQHYQEGQPIAPGTVLHEIYAHVKRTTDIESAPFAFMVGACAGIVGWGADIIAHGPPKGVSSQNAF